LHIRMISEGHWRLE